MTPRTLTEDEHQALARHAPGALAVMGAPVPATPELRASWLQAGRLALGAYRVRLLEAAKADGRDVLNPDEECAYQALDDSTTRFDEEVDTMTTTPSTDLVGRATAPPPIGDRLADPAREPLALATADGFGIPAGVSMRAGLLRSAEPGLTFGGLIRAMVVGARTAPEKRALAEGADSSGGITVPASLLPEWIDKLRSALVCVKAGARTVNLLTDNNTIARLTGDPTGTWRLENAIVAESDAVFDGVVFVPRSYAVLVKCSRELLQDSLNIDAMLGAAFVGSFAAEIDRVALRGSGTAPEPRGILNTTGVGATAVGGNLTWDVLLAAVGALGVANAPAPTAIVMNPANFARLIATKGTDGHYLAPPPGSLPPIYPTTGLASTDALLGNFPELYFGTRQELRVELVREAFAANLQYAFLAHLRFDVGLAHPASFHKLTGLTIT